MASFLEVCQTRHLRYVLECGRVRVQKMDSFLWVSDQIKKVLSGECGLAGWTVTLHRVCAVLESV